MKVCDGFYQIKKKRLEAQLGMYKTYLVIVPEFCISIFIVMKIHTLWNVRQIFTFKYCRLKLNVHQNSDAISFFQQDMHSGIHHHFLLPIQLAKTLAYLVTTNIILIESKYDRIREMWIQGNYPHAENHIFIGNQSSQIAAAS